MIYRRTLYLIPLSFVLYVVSILVCADQALGDSEPLTIYITGTTIPVSAEQEPRSTTIITRDEILRLNPRSVPELLKSVGGLHVENATSRGGLSGVYLRGGESNYTAVLIDGVKVNDSSNSRGGAYDFSLLDVGTIERIEIVKGPLSSVYGSDAMAGVINIVTTRPVSGDTVSWSAETGSRGLFAGRVLLGGTVDDSSLSLNAGFSDDGTQVMGSRFASASMNINGKTRFNNDKTKVALNGFYQHAQAEAFPDDSGGAKYAVIRQVDMRDMTQQQIGVEADHSLPEASRFKMQVSHFGSEERLDSPGIDSAIPAYITQSSYLRQQMLATYFVVAVSGLNTSVGVEFNREQGISNSVIDPGGADIPVDFKQRRNLYAGFVEFHYQFNDRLSAFGGIRVDSPDHFNNETSPRVGFDYRFGETSLGISWSEGFKLPGFFALSHPLVGNPSFKPETSESYELTLNHSFSSATKAQLALFDNRYFDLIDFDSSGVLVQRTEATTSGFELQLDHNVMTDVTLHLQYSAMKLDVVNSVADLLKRPERLAGAMLSWQLTPQFDLTGRASYIGMVKDFAYPTGVRTLDAYTRFDISMGWRWNNDWQGHFALDNVLDKNYEEAIGFVVPGIGLRVSVQGSI